ncbi:Protein transport protein bos1 [Polyrhizophydium stewartii]|uniref:Protein transport protein BOS1 n=1 Tax=Polyrhizophydium stewartii TaxID=2732419 RepID=A0ABR4NHL3_9FUNG
MSAAVIFSNAIKLKTELQADVASLTTAPAYAAGDLQGRDDAAKRIQAGLASLQRSIADLEDLARREVTAIKRETTSGRAAKLRDEAAQIQTAIDSYRLQEQQRIAEEQRAQLLGADHVLNQRTHGHAHAHGGLDGAGGNPHSEESTILMMDGLLREHTVLGTAEASIDQYLQIGRAALQELYDQRSMLKSTQKRLLDIANQLGLSATVIRFIEQRTAADRQILFAGIIVTVLIMVAIVYYLR